MHSRETALNYNEIGACEFSKCIAPNTNLLSNGSFEIGGNLTTNGTWGIFTTVSNWISSLADGIEVWRNFNGSGVDVASDGVQNIELDGKAPTKITQSVTTVPGATYELRFDFSPRIHTNLADNSIDALVDNNLLMNVSGDGSTNIANTWSTHAKTFVASGNSTSIGFEDKGTSNSLGSLMDNAVLCLVEKPDNNGGGGGGGGNQEKYLIFGNVWNDVDKDGVEVPHQEDGEGVLSGWTITITNGKTTFTTTTDSDGYYSFNVPAGTWTIDDGSPSGWDQTYPINQGNVHTVTVPELFTVIENENIFAMIKDFLVPTAMAAVSAPTSYGPFNFGNVAVVPTITSTGGGGGGGGSSSGSSHRNSHSGGGEVLGDATQKGEVLGESTSTLPVGAPNTGAGGTSPVAPVLPSFFAILEVGAGVRRVK